MIIDFILEHVKFLKQMLIVSEHIAILRHFTI